MGAVQALRTPPREGPAAGRVLIEGRGVRKTYRTRDGTREGEVETLKPLDFSIRDGEFVSVVGPSGCGKSTLMKLVAGLLPASGGELTLDGRPVKGPQTNVGIVFQNALLLPWRRVLENILLQAEVRKLPMEAARRRAAELIAMAGLQGFERKYPWQLSGGMQQRVSILRALLHDPPVLLMDEPFGALDAMTREKMNVELQRIWMGSGSAGPIPALSGGGDHGHPAGRTLAAGKTVLLITHSIPEAVFLSDRVLVMSERPGRIAAEYTIDLPRPRTLDVMASDAFSAYAKQLRSHFFAQGSLDGH